jgi:ankyrin repeat protein
MLAQQNVAELYIIRPRITQKAGCLARSVDWSAGGGGGGLGALGVRSYLYNVPSPETGHLHPTAMLRLARAAARDSASARLSTPRAESDSSSSDGSGSDDDDGDDADDAQRSLAHAAAVGNARKIVNVISSPYVVPDALDSTGYAPIHRASSGGHAVAVQRLIEGKANPNVRSVDGSTALHHACTTGNDAVVRVLSDVAHLDVDAADVGRATPLMAAALYGHATVVEALLRRKADASATDGSGATALMRACSQGHMRVAELLLAHRAPPDAQDADGESALHAAALSGQHQAAELLMRSGANPRLLNKDGCTAEKLATRRGHERCARALASASASAVAHAAPDRPAGGRPAGVHARGQREQPFAWARARHPDTPPPSVPSAAWTSEAEVDAAHEAGERPAGT